MSKRKSLLSDDAKRAIENAKYQKKLSKEIYKKKIKEMRPYLKKLKKVDLRKPISNAQKAVINKAWIDYQELTLRPHKIFRSKKKDTMAIAQKVAHRDATTKFDVAFIPTINNTAKVSVKNGKLKVSSKYIDEVEILFDMKALVTDPEKEIQRLIDENPEYQQFVLMAGKSVWNGGIARGFVMKRVLPHLMRYVPGGEGYEKRGPNSHYQNWAFGLIGFKAKKQHAIEDFLKDYHNANNARKQTRRRVRRKRLRDYGEKF